MGIVFYSVKFAFLTNYVSIVSCAELWIFTKFNRNIHLQSILFACKFTFISSWIVGPALAGHFVKFLSKNPHKSVPILVINLLCNIVGISARRPSMLNILVTLDSGACHELCVIFIVMCSDTSCAIANVERRTQRAQNKIYTRHTTDETRPSLALHAQNDSTTLRNRVVFA